MMNKAGDICLQLHLPKNQGDRSASWVSFSHVQDGSLVDLLEKVQKDKAHLPVQDVLSIFFQVLLKQLDCKAC